LFYFRTIAFSILLLILGEAIAISAVTWSFLESATSSFQFIKVSSDNRARDTVVSLAKASEIRMNSKGYLELQKTFSRLKSITEKDPDGFRVLEIILLNPNGVVLANSESEEIETSLKERKADEKYKSNLYESTLRMRKWQYPEPVILPENLQPSQKSNWIMNQLEILVYKFFPEAKEQKAMASVAVYHETKLDVVGGIHLVYSRGNISLFLDKQKDIYLWMLRTYAILAFVISLALIIIFIIVSIFNARNSDIKKKHIPETATNPPLVQKIVVQEELPKSEAVVMDEEKHQPNKESSLEPVSTPIPVNPTPSVKVETPKSLTNPMRNPSEFSVQEEPELTKRKVVDAIYLGKNGS